MFSSNEFPALGALVTEVEVPREDYSSLYLSPETYTSTEITSKPKVNAVIENPCVGPSCPHVAHAREAVSNKIVACCATRDKGNCIIVTDFEDRLNSLQEEYENMYDERYVEGFEDGKQASSLDDEDLEEEFINILEQEADAGTLSLGHYGIVTWDHKTDKQKKLLRIANCDGYYTYFFEDEDFYTIFDDYEDFNKSHVKIGDLFVNSKGEFNYWIEYKGTNGDQPPSYFFCSVR